MSLDREPLRGFDGEYATEVPSAITWGQIGRRALIVANVVALVAGALWAGDYWIRHRAAQMVNAYHQGVIVPLTQPKAPAGAPAAPAPGGK